MARWRSLLHLPVTFYFSPLGGIAYLIGIMKGGTFGGSIAAILLNTPGSPEAAATAFDGYPLAQKGKALKAMKMALYSSVFGDTLQRHRAVCRGGADRGRFALLMGPPEMAAVLIFSLTIIAGLSGKSLLRGVIAAAVGRDSSARSVLTPESALPRLTFGFVELEDGVPLIPLTIGLLALSEIHHPDRGPGPRPRRRRQAYQPLRQGRSAGRSNRHLGGMARAASSTIMRSSLIGTGIGALPGIGAVVAGFLGYAAAKRASKTPEFGTGRLEGVAAVEAANSAVTGANLIPLLAIGIPGSLSAAILIGAFLVHGVQPGPLIFQDHARLVYGIFAAMAIGNSSTCSSDNSACVCSPSSSASPTALSIRLWWCSALPAPMRLTTACLQWRSH